MKYIDPFLLLVSRIPKYIFQIFPLQYLSVSLIKREIILGTFCILFFSSLKISALSDFKNAFFIKKNCCFQRNKHASIISNTGHATLFTEDPIFSWLYGAPSIGLNSVKTKIFAVSAAPFRFYLRVEGKGTLKTKTTLTI